MKYKQSSLPQVSLESFLEEDLEIKNNLHGELLKEFRKLEVKSNHSFLMKLILWEV
jgi:hypothetical protein